MTTMMIKNRIILREKIIPMTKMKEKKAIDRVDIIAFRSMQKIIDLDV